MSDYLLCKYKLLANNAHDLEKALEKMKRRFQKYNLVINWKKH